MIINWQTLRHEAQRSLPAFVFSYVDGGADDEKTLTSNTSVFDRWQFLPAVLKDTSQRDLSIKLGSSSLLAPLLVAPTGYNGMLRYQADIMLARAASQQGIGHIQSTVSTASIEQLAAVSSGSRWFQLYVLKDRNVTRDLIERAQRAGCEALVVSVDAVHFGNRERDKAHYRRPMKLSWKAMFDAARHPGWLSRTLIPQGMPGFGNLTPYLPAEYQKGMGAAAYFASQMDQALNWQTLAWIRELWTGPLYVKGISTVQDAITAKQVGADGVVLSNHGGRQLDGCISPMLILEATRRAVGSDFKLIIDSGFRRGTDVVKALALGADAVSLGRPLLYAVATGGEARANQTMASMIQEIDRTLAQLGCSKISELNPDMLLKL
ncbi:alpha-hydroxy acid oxidase [Pantoea sp. GM01]|uniref:alpha-hydroxy acid oxidase n=1 Tax=Pantoea sp. GM01 TaxID=1144320 RepID=UPI000270E90D|nr:alpha-hydroxy acid oxidase [Pantoea sp. GM01]EJL93152.1 alpha-hydroxyacid dehydrogenase, FMN-dependent L-lactate dehydrogenase [Pantoea sp. GM01]